MKKNNLTVEQKKEQKFKEKIKKRRLKLAKKFKKRQMGQETIQNYTIIRERSSEYVPLSKIGFFGKIAMSVRYVLDNKYRKDKLIREKRAREEKILLSQIRLKKFILDCLQKVPNNSKEITIQIDYIFTDVIESVLNTTPEFNNYDIEEIKMNKNYLKYIKKPHKLYRFTPRYTI